MPSCSLVISICLYIVTMDAHPQTSAAKTPRTDTDVHKDQQKTTAKIPDAIYSGLSTFSMRYLRERWLLGRQQ